MLKRLNHFNNLLLIIHLVPVGTSQDVTRLKNLIGSLIWKSEHFNDTFQRRSITCSLLLDSVIR